MVQENIVSPPRQRTTKRMKLANPIAFPNHVKYFEAPIICTILHMPEYIRRSAG